MVNVAKTLCYVCYICTGLVLSSHPNIQQTVTFGMEMFFLYISTVWLNPCFHYFPIISSCLCSVASLAQISLQILSLLIIYPVGLTIRWQRPEQSKLCFLEFSLKIGQASYSLPICAASWSLDAVQVGRSIQLIDPFYQVAERGSGARVNERPRNQHQLLVTPKVELTTSLFSLHFFTLLWRFSFFQVSLMLYFSNNYTRFNINKWTCVIKIEVISKHGLKRLTH